MREEIAFADRDAPGMLPCKPGRGQPVGARDVGERALVVRDIRQKQPCLERGMERVRVELELGIGGPWNLGGGNRLNVIERLRPGACDIRKE